MALALYRRGRGRLSTDTLAPTVLATLAAVPDLELPSGVYLSLANVVRARFGGQTRAHLMRNRFFTQHAGVDTTICCFDPHPLYALERQRLTERGELVPGMRLLNIYEYYREQELDLGRPTAEALPVLERVDAVDVAHPDGTVLLHRLPGAGDRPGRRPGLPPRRTARSTCARRRRGSRATARQVTLVDRHGRPDPVLGRPSGAGVITGSSILVGDAPRAIVISDSRDALRPLMPFPTSGSTSCT